MDGASNADYDIAENKAEQKKAITGKVVDAGYYRRYASTLQPGAGGYNVGETENASKGVLSP